MGFCYGLEVSYYLFPCLLFREYLVTAIFRALAIE